MNNNLLKNEDTKKNFKELCKTEERYIQSVELLNFVSPKNTRDCDKDNNEGCELMFTESKRRTRRCGSCSELQGISLKL